MINRPKTKTDRIAFCSSQPTNQARHEIAISEAWKHWKMGGSGAYSENGDNCQMQLRRRVRAH